MGVCSALLGPGARMSRADFLPSVSLPFSAEHQGTSAQMPTPFPLNGVRYDGPAYNALMDFGWEIDLWGKFRRTIESDRAAFLGALASFDDVLVTLIADVATSYVNIRTLEARIRVAHENLEAQRESLRVAKAQFDAGETGELDVQQSSTVLLQTTAQVPRRAASLPVLGREVRPCGPAGRAARPGGCPPEGAWNGPHGARRGGGWNSP